jgi:hypothetical protein
VAPQLQDKIAQKYKILVVLAQQLQGQKPVTQSLMQF